MSKCYGNVYLIFSQRLRYVLNTCDGEVRKFIDVSVVIYYL